MKSIEPNKPIAGKEDGLIYQERLRSLVSRQSLDGEKKCRQIVEKLQGSIGAPLTVANIKLGVLQNGVDSENAVKLNEIRNLIGQAICSMRQLSTEISPPVLYEIGFEAAVEWLVEKICGQYPLISIKIEDDMQDKPMNEATRVIIFQAIRELLANIVKHAQPRNITVSIKRKKADIHIDITDYGLGLESQNDFIIYKNPNTLNNQYDPDELFGLFNIREYLGHIGGYIKIKSDFRKNTRISLIIPLPELISNGKEKLVA
ncbi:ATP-binding protein [Desulfobacterales bacterium HSG16]|nr:ATP-binding protein [Desulfobacterales bacterium HSG16]